MNEENMQTFM